MGWHIVVTEEMRALGLSGNDLMVFALINGFSQDGQGCFYGSLPYICETCGISKRTAIYILNDLVERGFLMKNETIQNGVKRVIYQVNRGSAEIAPGGSAEIAPNNTIPYENKKISKATAPLDLPFSSDKFRETWEMLCEEKEWKKKTANALRLALKDLGKYDEDFAIELMEKTIKNGWRGVVFADTDAKYQEWKSARQHAADNQQPRTATATRPRAIPQNNQIDEFYRKRKEQEEAEREAQIAALKAKYGNND